MGSNTTIDALLVLKELFPDISFDLCTEIDFRIDLYNLDGIEVSLSVGYLHGSSNASNSVDRSWVFSTFVEPQITLILSSFGVTAAGVSFFHLFIDPSGVTEITTTRFLEACTPASICREKMAEWFEVTGR